MIANLNLMLLFKPAHKITILFSICNVYLDFTGAFYWYFASIMYWQFMIVSFWLSHLLRKCETCLLSSCFYIEFRNIDELKICWCHKNFETVGDRKPWHLNANMELNFNVPTQNIWNMHFHSCQGCAHWR